MTAAGRKQLIGVAALVLSFAALGGLLFYRQHCHQNRMHLDAEIHALGEGLRQSADDRDKVVRNISSTPEQRNLALAEFAAKKSEVETGQARLTKEKAAAAPLASWPRALSVALGWLLGLLPVAAFLFAINSATEHGRKFVVTFTIAVVAAGLTQFRGVAKGIDLAGGAELRYRMETDEIDAKIRQWELWHDALAKGGAGAAGVLAEIDGRIAELRKQREQHPSEVSRRDIDVRIQEFTDMRDPQRLGEMIATERSVRDDALSATTLGILKRMDSSGMLQVTVQQTDNGRGLLAQVPIPEVPLTKGMTESERRSRQMAMLGATLAELKELVSTPGILGLHHVDACRSYQHNAERWKDAQEKRDLKKIDEKTKRPVPQEVIPGYLMVDYVIVDRLGKEEPEPLLLRKKPVVDGRQVARALIGRGEDGKLQVDVWLRTVGGEDIRKFTDPTNEDFKIVHDRDRLAVVLDGEVRTAPVVQSQLGTQFRITGNFTHKEADKICQVLNAGSLVYVPQLISENRVGPGLGRDSIEAGTRATLVGAALVFLVVGIFYLGAGLAANLALALNLAIIVGAMSALGGTMTLPGIAGIALTMGMAVDANVLIFERIREEKARGKPLKLAVKTGHERALVTIVDANVTTLITALILYAFGTGAVRGFAVTLGLGILASMFTALYVTRAILDFGLSRGWATELKMLRLVGVTAFKFVSMAPLSAALSLLLVGGSAFLFFATPDKYGLDFTGGVEVQVKFREQQWASEVRAKADLARRSVEQAVAEAASARGVKAPRVPEFSVQSFNPAMDGSSRDFRIFCQLDDAMLDLIERKPEAAEGVADVPAKAEADVAPFFENAFGKENLDAEAAFPMISRIGSAVAGELLQKAMMALAFSVIVIFFYIVVRFDFMVGFGLGAAVALVHDAVIALGALLLANRLGLAGARIDLVIVAGLLTIIGYSLNDTIVVFDRIRENRAALRSMSLRDLVDLSANQALARTLMTSLTTLVAVVAILVLGGSVLRPFALVFTVGVVVGTYSSVFVASLVAVYWEAWRDRRKEAARKRLRGAPEGAG